MSWQQVKIGSFLKRIKRPVKIEANREYKLVTIRINHNGVSLREIKKGIELKSNMYEVKEGDFILSGIDARNGAFGIIPKDLDGALVTNDFWYFEIDESVIDKHFFLELTSTNWFDDICKRGSDGTTQRIRLQKDKFFNQSIALPQTPTLQKELLSKVTRIRNSQKGLCSEIALQKEYLAKLKQSILQDAICGKLTEAWREANPNIEPASELLKRIKAEKQRQIKEGKIRKEKPLDPITDTDLPFTIPPTWQWCRLGDLCSLMLSGFAFDSKLYSKSTTYNQIIRLGNVKPDCLLLSTNPVYISDDYASTTEKYRLIINDLLLTMTGTREKQDYLFSLIITDKHIENKNLYLNQRVACLRLTEIINTNFVCNVLKLPSLLMPVYESATGTANQANVGVDAIKNIKICLAPIEEQKRIVEIIKNSLEKCSLIEAQITANEQTAQNLIKSILSETFSNN